MKLIIANFFQDIDVRNVGDSLSPSELNCDVCCLLYDVSSPRSFEFIAKIYLVRIKLITNQLRIQIQNKLRKINTERLPFATLEDGL